MASRESYSEPMICTTEFSAPAEVDTWQEEEAYRTTDPFEADFGEFLDTLYLAKVCLEHKISYEILPE